MRLREFLLVLGLELYQLIYTYQRITRFFNRGAKAKSYPVVPVAPCADLKEPVDVFILVFVKVRTEL